MRQMTLPTIITILRLIAVPVVMIGMLLDHQAKEPSLFTLVIYSVAAITDWLDGYLARRLNQVSELGKFLDPLVDKLLVLGPLLIFVEMGTLPAWPVFIIISRDLVISGWRVSQGTVSAANRWGKAKTLAQLIAIGCLIAPLQFTDQFPAREFLANAREFGRGLFWVSVVLTVISGLIYLWPNLKGDVEGVSMEDDS